MTPEMEALGRRAVACKEWRWMPGMLAVGRACPPVRVVEINDSGNAISEPGHDGLSLWLPDLSDPATLGCLWSLVGDPGAPMDAVVLVGMLEGKS